MFFSISQVEQAAHYANELKNPQNINNVMTLGIYRTKMRMVIGTVYSKKAFADFWDDVEKKKIARKLWTPEMKNLAERKIAEAPKAPFIFKLSIFGWIFLAGVIALFGMLIYESVKPAPEKPAEVVAMQQMPQVGDVYFGHFEKRKDKNAVVGTSIGYGWFKVTKVDRDTYALAKSIEMSTHYKPKEQMNSTDFETEAFTNLKLTENTGYSTRFKSTDELTELTLGYKK